MTIIGLVVKAVCPKLLSLYPFAPWHENHIRLELEDHLLALGVTHYAAQRFHAAGTRANSPCSSRARQQPLPDAATYQAKRIRDIPCRGMLVLINIRPFTISTHWGELRSCSWPAAFRSAY